MVFAEDPKSCRPACNPTTPKLVKKEDFLQKPSCMMKRKRKLEDFLSDHMVEYEPDKKPCYSSRQTFMTPTYNRVPRFCASYPMVPIPSPQLCVLDFLFDGELILSCTLSLNLDKIRILSFCTEFSPLS